MNEELKALTDSDVVYKQIVGYWAGIATFFGRDHEPDPAKSDIALVGVPHSAGNGTTERDQHFGPRVFRDVSMSYQRIHRYLGFSPWDICSIHDLGDVPLPRAMVNELCMKDISAYFDKVAASGARPVSIGGDHSISLPIIRSLTSKGSKLTEQPIALVHFDAHSDTVAGEFLGNEEWCGAPFYYANEEGHVNPDKVVQVGMRGHTKYDNYGEMAGFRIIDMDEFEDLGVKGTIAEIRNRIGDAPTYVTFDLDALDPSHAPGVANLTPGFDGLTIGQATKIIRGLLGCNIIGADLVCPMPTKDNLNRITALNGSVILFEYLCLIADYLRSNSK